jgi:tRNA(Ile)-lysidine synthase TilS/MesJ
MKIKDVELFTDDILDIINQQEFIGIRLSGGIDSATLCHIVLHYFPHIKILPITFYNALRPGAVKSVENVLRILKELNPNHQIMKQEIGTFDTTGYVRSNINDGVKRNPKDIFQKQFIRELFDKYSGRLNFVLTGETLNPPLEEQEKLLPGIMNEFPKDRNVPKAKLLHRYSYGDVAKYEYAPFRNYNKKQISDIVKELGLINELFPVTETCETEPSKYNSYISKAFGIEYSAEGIEPCQCCWPCREKYWAYGVFDFNTENRSVV